MQLLLIAGVCFAIMAVTFALQNNTAVVVAFALWHFEGSLAVVLLLALGLGVIIAGLVSSPAMIKGQWAASRLRRQVAELEGDKAALKRQVDTLKADLAKVAPVQDVLVNAEKPYVGLTQLIMPR